MAMSARQYWCGDKRMKAAILEVEQVSGRTGGSLTPEGVIAAGSVEAANLLTDNLPWLDGSGTVIAAAFLLIIGTVGVNGFCEWSGQYVDDQAMQGPLPDS
jgi:hypothetical protein